jgi:hypothetical protein
LTVASNSIAASSCSAWAASLRAALRPPSNRFHETLGPKVQPLLEELNRSSKSSACR